MFTKDDIAYIEERGVDLQAIYSQIENFKKGFPSLNILAAATTAKGISVLNEQDQNQAIEIINGYSGRTAKFVPASGAASRMFKDLYQAQEILEQGETIDADSPIADFFNNLEKFPFFNQLSILNLTLGDKALGYATKPKGQIFFHKYTNEVRTAFEEHLVEGAMYCKDSNGIVNIHFTVSPEHIDGFKDLLESVRDRYEKRFDCRYNILFSTQSPSTDILAVDEDNNPFRDEKGELLFRPGGHGALLKNLNETPYSLVIIKNIDNVVKEQLVDQTVRWKKILAGKLLESKERVFYYLEKLDNVERGGEDATLLYTEIANFLESCFCIKIPKLNEGVLHDYLKAKLDRPIRVCGMVKNEGEPGGGPFIVKDNDGSTSLQILESAQLDMNNPAINEMVKNSTHFNPVDLVVWLENYKGERFDLNRFTDPLTGFISSKSYEGRKLKAQELPGLWNGAMSNWNTIFVETPLITFNPVKTVMDLLRPEHQGEEM